MSRIYRTLGTVSVVPKGNYNSETYYDKLNLVFYNGATYIATEPVQGEDPLTSSKWQLISGGITKYDSIEDMKDDNSLKDGMLIQLIGKTSKNDGVNQLFVIETASGSEIDGKNDCFILDNGLIAKRVKEKAILSLSPNITSNEFIKNLDIENTSTSAASAGLSFSGVSNVNVFNSNITGGYWSVRIGNENDTNNTTNVKIINSKLTSPHGLSLRHKTGQSDGGEHTLMLNEINNTSSNPGVESWAKEVQVLFNRITNTSGSVGGTGGITFGNKNNQMAIGNYVKNYGYGIEVGNSDLNIVSGNFIENCDKGIVCSSDNTHNVIISNNIIKLKQNGDGIYLKSGDKVIIDNCIFIYGNANADYNDNSSRSGRGIYSDTYPKNIEVSNCVFINIANVSLSEKCNVSNCTFINCRISSSLNNQHFTNCSFINTRLTYGGLSGRYVTFTNCYFERSSDATANQYIFSGRGNSTPGIAIFENCQTNNCTINTLVQNSEAGGSDIRFISQKINGIYHTYNRTQLSDIKTVFEAMGYTLQPGDRIIDDYNKKQWEVMTQNRHISYQKEVPTTGTFVKGDRIYNNFASTSTVDHWICTTAGTFGTETEPVFTAHNI